MLEAGYEIERYIVEGVLGEGGMAVVYMVRHGTLGTRHALKVLSVTNKQVRERLIQEGQLQATLRHPNIVGVTDVIDVAGAPGLLMEYIEGAGLDHWLNYYQPTLDESLTVFKAIVAGVAHAHSKSLIHRDLKPGNVMLHVTSQGVVPKVTDFGLAKATNSNDMSRTRTGATMGTPAYMAPEQIRDASSVDRRADLYSLGVILYELTCGRTPYEEDDMLELFTMIRAGDYPSPHQFKPDLPQAVVDTIDALITVKPEDRLSDCAAILELLAGEGGATPISQGSVEALGPPRPIPPMMVTTLPPSGPAAKAARSMILEVQAIPTGPTGDHRWANRVSSPSRVEPPALPLPSLEAPAPVPAPASSKVFGVFAVAAIGLLLFAVIVLGFMVVGLVLGEVDDTVVEVPKSASDPVPVDVEPVPKPTPKPTPAPVPDAPPDPVPSPVPSRPDPVPARPDPAPRPAPVAAPTPRPDPAPKPTGGKFSVDADGPMAITVQATQGQTYGPGHTVPPGSYDILINGRRGAGKVTIRAGKTARLQCFSAASRCKVR